MSSQRLDHALNTGRLDLPHGPVLALRPPSDLQGLPLERTQIVHGFKPDVVLWEAQGQSVVQLPEGRFAGVYIALPRSKSHARNLLAQALDHAEPNAMILVDGQKTDGIDSLLKEAKRLFEVRDVVSKSHGKLFWFAAPEVLPDAVAGWAAAPEAPEGWVTASAGFSATAIDDGSALLASHLPNKPKGHVADLGAGWGYLAKAVLGFDAVTQVDLVEAEHAALEAAKQNITDSRARFFWADATAFGAPASYDLILCNPPFHTSRKADPALGQAFLRQAARLLKPSGVLALVANRHLPYEQTLEDCFGEAETMTEERGYKIIHARKPRPGAGRRAS